MIRNLLKGYRRWQRLNHGGLNEDDFGGLRKFEQAKAIGFIVAFIPTIPLMLSDMLGLDRGWLWYGWSVIAVGWFVSILGLIAWNVGRSLTVYMRNWRAKKK